MTLSIIIADANILFSRTLRDYVLYADDAGAIKVRWTQAILDEMSSNMRAKHGFTQAQTDRLEALMNEFLDEALIEIQPEDEATVAVVQMDPKDRHVLAGALSADADIVLTSNVKHFPRDWMSERGVGLLTPAEFFDLMLDTQPEAMRASHERTVASTPKSEGEVLEVLERIIGADVVERLRAAT